MAGAAVADPSLDPPNGAAAGDGFDGLAIPPMDHSFFDTLPDSAANGFDPFSQDDTDIMLDDFDLDFCFDDILPASLEQPLPDATQFDDDCFLLGGSDTNSAHFQQDRVLGDVSRAFKKSSAEFPHDISHDGVITNSSSSPEPEVCELSADQVSGDRSSGMNLIGQDVSGYLNVSSPESNGSKGSNDSRVLNCPSPESHGSENCRSHVSQDSNRSVSSSPNSVVQNEVVDSEIKLEELNGSMFNNSLLKRKKETDDSGSIEVKTSKFRKSTVDSISSAFNEVNSNNNNNVPSEEEEKKKARLMRNRESAQLSRQRKKHYVEELEDKVKSMHSTIQDLNAKISYFMAENATLRQQMGGSGVAPPPMAGPAPPGMYTHPPPMMYPWMPCGVPPYMVKPQGSQVPLVPIPRLKPQQVASAPRVNKKGENKKSEGKAKKVASVSFLGLLFFVLLFGGLVPMVNVSFGGGREAFNGGPNYAGGWFYEKHRDRVLTENLNISGNGYGEKFGGNGNEHNHSEPLMASLYVPRNDRMVKIDGNLIIHSVLASEKAMASHRDPANKAGSETSLVVSTELAPVVPVSGGLSPHLHRQRALGSTSVGNENLKSPATDGTLQQWFREGLAGPMLSSEMCTEVFQFDISAASGPGAIVPVAATAASSSRNVSVGEDRNCTDTKRGERNRRILRGLPVTLPGSSHNISSEGERKSQKENFNGNNSLSPMVVSVLVDPREVGDGEIDGVMGTKSLSRIFVVVLIDSVKYVTYSCMLPFKGGGPHLVTT